MENIKFQIHWFALTIFAPYSKAFDMYDAFFKEDFGNLCKASNGANFYKEKYYNNHNISIYREPVVFQDNEHFFYEIKGSACDFISPEKFIAIGNFLSTNYPNKFKIDRMDLAFDNVPFNPFQANVAFKANQIRTSAKREKISFHDTPSGKNLDGSIGSQTLEIGSKSSERRVIIYNKRGPTRCEFEIKGKRVNYIGKQILSKSDTNKWTQIALPHLMDFIEFYTDWWNEFVGQNKRAHYVLDKPHNLDISHFNKWLLNLAVPLSILYDCLGKNVFEKLLEYGRTNRNWNKKYNHFLNHKEYLEENMSNLIDDSMKLKNLKYGVRMTDSKTYDNSLISDEKSKQFERKNTSFSYKPEIPEVSDLEFTNKEYVSTKHIESPRKTPTKINQVLSSLEIQEK